jgi:hypothetical protein
MTSCKQIADHIRQVHFGGNWTWSNLKDQLSDVDWQQATRKAKNFNTIATLTFHINYFVKVQIKFLKEGMVEGSDKESFDHPPIQSSEDWKRMIDSILGDGETLAQLVEKLPDDKLDQAFGEDKYGTYFRNLVGMIEHTHYHLGQLALIKKLTA